MIEVAGILTKSITLPEFRKGSSGGGKKQHKAEKALSLSQGVGSTSEADGKSSPLTACIASESPSRKLKTSFSPFKID